MNPEYIAERLGLKKFGGEFKGPCVVCGGTDRFSVKRGKTHDVIYHCRQGCQFIEIVKELQDRGIIENDFKPDPSFISEKMKDELRRGRIYIAMFDNQYKDVSHAHYKEQSRYKVAKAKVMNLEERMGIVQKSEYSY